MNRGNDINNYIQNLDAVLEVSLLSGDADQEFIDPSIQEQQDQQHDHQQQPQTEDNHQRLQQQHHQQQSRQQQLNLQDNTVHAVPNTTVDVNGNGIVNSALDIEIPEIPPLPEGVDPKKMCPFCQKTFSHPGSMGRHLDLKKGTRLHPAYLIEKMRADVKRRGDVEKIKERRRARAKRYNSKAEVKERTKIQRRVRDKLMRAKRRMQKMFLANLGRADLGDTPSFPRLVFYFLPPAQWPHDPPTLDTYRLLCGVLNTKFLPGDEEDVKAYDDVMRKVHLASEQWLVLSEDVKHGVWVRELRQAAMDSLVNTSLYELRYRDDLIAKMANKRVEEINSGLRKDDDDDDDDDENESTDDKSDKEQQYYDQEELAAVAEAVVNNTQS